MADDQPDAAEDTDLSPAEKEFYVGFSKADDRLHVHSEIGSITRALLSRDEFDVEREREKEGTIVAVSGTLPIGALKIPSNVREHDRPSAVVSTHG